LTHCLACCKHILKSGVSIVLPIIKNTSEISLHMRWVNMVTMETWVFDVCSLRFL
jgi:hypothetical protein